MPKKDAKLLTLVICSVGAILAVTLLYFPLSLPWMLQHSGGVAFFGTAWRRDVAKIYEIFDALGAVGRRDIFCFTWTIDLALPLLFGWTLYAAIGNGAERAFGGARTAGGFRWMAVAAAGSDYLENTSITVLLAAYPDRLPTLASVSVRLTEIKFALYGGCIFVAIAMFLIAFMRRV